MSVQTYNQTSAVPVEFHWDLVHAQTVETRPFSPPRLGPGNEAKVGHVNILRTASRGPERRSELTCTCFPISTFV